MCYLSIYQSCIHSLIQVDPIPGPDQALQLLYSIVAGKNVIVHQDQLVRVRSDNLPPFSVRSDISFLVRDHTPPAMIRASPCKITDSVITFRVYAVIWEHPVNLVRQRPVYWDICVSRSAPDRISRKIRVNMGEIEHLLL